MDQVTSFMEKQLKSTKRYEEDKILTKTMINNYAKNDLLPPPNKKKYSKEHLLVLTFIYYFKNILSMKDIEMLLGPITDKYFESKGDVNVARVYDEVCAFELERTKILQKDIEVMYNNSMETFVDVPEEDREALQMFSFICSLSCITASSFSLIIEYLQKSSIASINSANVLDSSIKFVFIMRSPS